MNLAIRARIQPMPHDYALDALLAKIRGFKVIVPVIPMESAKIIRPVPNITPRRWGKFQNSNSSRVKPSPFPNVLPSRNVPNGIKGIV